MGSVDFILPFELPSKILMHTKESKVLSSEKTEILYSQDPYLFIGKCKSFGLLIKKVEDLA